MTTLKAEISGVKFTFDTTKVMAKLKPSLLRYSRATCEDIVQEFRALASGELVNVQTGNYRSGIVIEEVAGERFGHRVVLTDPKARWIEYGTKAHDIWGNDFLAFQRNGETVIARYVRHPGTTPRKVLMTAVQNVTGRSTRGLQNRE